MLRLGHSPKTPKKYVKQGLANYQKDQSGLLGGGTFQLINSSFCLSQIFLMPSKQLAH
jgi:hypothetical protein